MARKHQELVAWRGSVALVKEVYRASGGFPLEDLNGLTGQIRRTAVSIPATIAEGAARSSKKEFLQSLNVAVGQLAALETYVVLSKELGYLREGEKLSGLIEDVAKLVAGLTSSVRRGPTQGS
ncbi:MAG: four helix bundle protein [Proteobacteria bacterium]|nr:four helix bundle protein [Burkholderiales bacterium]